MSNSNHGDTQRVDSYVRNLLSLEERQAFEAELQHDNQLRSLVAERARLSEALRAEPDRLTWLAENRPETLALLAEQDARLSPELEQSADVSLRSVLDSTFEPTREPPDLEQRHDIEPELGP